MLSVTRLLRLIAGVIIAVAIGCGGPAATSPGSVTPPPTAPPPPAPPPDPAIPIVRGSTIGRAVYPPGNSEKGGQGETISGVSCISSDGAYHLHSHLTLFVKGEQIAIAAGIGVLPPTLTDGYIIFNSSYCFYWLHTHDATGVIHVNPAVQKDMTLGMLFDVWGYTLSRTEVAGNVGPVVAYVDGALYSGDLREIVFVANREISLQVGEPLVTPPLYRIPANP